MGGFLQADALKAHPLAGTQLSQQAPISLDDVRDLWIAADCLPVHAQDDALAVACHLNASGPDRLRYQLACWNGERRTVEPYAHAIECRRHRIFVFVKRAL